MLNEPEDRVGGNSREPSRFEGAVLPFFAACMIGLLIAGWLVR